MIVPSCDPRWLDQTLFVTDTTGGNCMQAAVASLLALPLDAVPNFREAADAHPNDALQAWVGARGFELHRRGPRDRPYVVPSGLYLAMGPTVRGTQHMVVMRGDKLVHDPHPSRAGLTAVRLAYVLIPLDPARTSPAVRRDVALSEEDAGRGPDAPLKAQVRRLEDTLSAFTVLAQHFRVPASETEAGTVEIEGGHPKDGAP